MYQHADISNNNAQTGRHMSKLKKNELNRNGQQN